MTVHVAIVGIDGSGKSTVTACLPAVLAAELDCRAGSLGDLLRLVEPDRDLAGPGFEPDGVPLSLRAGRLLRVLAKRAASSRLLYPPLKLGQLACQRAAARRLGRRHRLTVMISDGDLVISAAARAADYGGRTAAGDLVARHARHLPDVVVVLDVSPEQAMDRIRGRGCRIDRHENEPALARTRRGYLDAVDAFRRLRPQAAALVVPAGDVRPGELVARLADALAPLLAARRSASPADEARGALHRSRSVRALGPAAARLLNPRYSLGHLLLHAAGGAWREPCFLLSGPGRRLLREGYSADLMRLIYDADERRAGPAERAFLGYPLHRAVADRLSLLTGELEAALAPRLESGPVTVLTAPSGYAYDLFLPLERIAARRPELPARLHLVAADLDPDGRLAGDLAGRAGRLGVRLRFHRGDLTDPDCRAVLAAERPFDLALFVGLSAWLPKPDLVDHLRWLRRVLPPDGLLVTDCFSPAAHAAGGHHLGYRASYFRPEEFAAILDVCGFEGEAAAVRPGRDGHNHVFLVRPQRAGCPLGDR